MERPKLVTPTFVLVTVTAFAYFVAIGILIPTLPVFVKGPPGGGDLAVGLSVGSFSISALVLRPWTGRLGDRWGRRPLLLSGATLVALSIAGLLEAESIAAVVALRLLTGVGEALFFVGAASAVNDLAPASRRGEAVSLFSLALFSALAIGPVLGELLLGDERFWAVWVAGAASALIAALLAMLIPETRKAVRGHQPPSRLVHPAAVRPGLVLMTSIWGFAGFNAFLALYARELGLSGSRILFVEFAVIVLVIRSLGARIPDKLGFARCARIALSGSALGLAVMGLWRSPAGLGVGVSLFAVGQGLAFPALMALAVSGGPAEELGAVVGTFTAFSDLAFGLGALMLGGVAEVLGYEGTFLVAAVVAAFGLILLHGVRPEARGVCSPRGRN